MSASFPVVREGTLSALLRTLAAARPDAEAYVMPGFVHDGVEVRLTFAQLDAEVDALARGLLALGVRAGEHVALWAPNVPAWVPLEFALARLGAVLVTMNTSLTRDEADYVLRQSRAVALLHTTTAGGNPISAHVDAILDDDPPPALRARVWMPATRDEPAPHGVRPSGDGASTSDVPGASRHGAGAGRAASRGTLATLAELVHAGSRIASELLSAREAATEPDDPVNIQYTSGTTGFPKGVVLSHANLIGNASMLGDVLGIGEDDRVLLMVPLFHCFGCAVAVLGTYTHGATLCALPAFEPGAALRLVAEERCTIVHGVPTMYAAMLAHPERARFDTRSLRAGLAAGAPCPVPLMEAIARDLHCPGIAVAYGLTEASPAVTGCRPDDPVALRCETVGRALPGIEVRLVDPDTSRDVGIGETGELWAKGPNVMLGYHDDPVATQQALTADGWLRTGDLATRDADGVVRIVGRSKDIIIRGGENIAPAEIENLLREHPDVDDVAVVGVPDEHMGEEIAACLVLAPGATLDEAALAALLEGRVAKFKVPRVWRAFARFPLTGSGKVQKFRLREMLADG
ncbi:MAG: AMP-binding protein [Planctomycetes bacterium]|nr:AMP-binding protein [Planctomycetota bacterium]